MDRLNDSFNELNVPSTLTLLAFFCRHPTARKYVRQVARDTGLTPGTCATGLKRLAHHGLLLVERQGNQLHYGLNHSSPVVRQMRILLNVIEASKLVEPVKRQCWRMVLYGSRATGDDAEGSDFDVLVVTDHPEQVKRMLAPKRASGLAPLIVDRAGLVRVRLRDKPLHDRIMKGVELWRRPEDGKH